MDSRDQSIDRLLRQGSGAPPHGRVTDACLDAETAAAWADGGLSGPALEMAQTHVAGCARCQSLIGALLGVDSFVAAAEPERAGRRWWLAWFVPLTAAAAAVVLWVVVPRDAVDPPRPVEVQQQAADMQRDRALPDDFAKAPALAEKREEKKEESRRDAIGRVEDGRRNQEPAQTAKVAPAAPTPPAVAAAPQVGAAAAKSANLEQYAARSLGALPSDIVSPDPSIRWRIAGSALQRSTTGGSQWDTVSIGIGAELTAGAAPSPTVLWLVGRGGAVLLSTDGRTWRRLGFPEMTDLSSVRATDARTASVTTADGRTFSTTDGGATWVRT